MMTEPPRTYLDLVAACDKSVARIGFHQPVAKHLSFPYTPDAASEYYELYLSDDNQAHGYMHPAVVANMPWNLAFTVDHQRRTVHTTSLVCSAALQQLVDTIIDQDLFEIVAGRHSEYFSVPGALSPVEIERFAVGLFGTTSRGAHLTAYIRTAEGAMKIWVPRRSSALKTYPGMLDTTVAGGVQAQESPCQTIIHEADEEASLPEALVRRDMKSCGVLTYVHRTDDSFFAEKGLVMPDMLYVYDIELELNTTPTPKDDEVKEFCCMSIWEIQDALKGGAFKPNSAVVMIDFFIRHGIITPENEEDITEICMRMHRRLPFPVSTRR